MSGRPLSDVSDMRVWTVSENFDDWSVICCDDRHLDLVSDPDEFSLTHRAARIGPVAIAEAIVGADMSMDRTELCELYRVVILKSGRMECVDRGAAINLGPGDAAVCAPGGLSGTRWAAGTRTIAVVIDRWAVNDALTGALGRDLTTKVDFMPLMTPAVAWSQTWLKMVALLNEQLFRPDGLFNQPMVGLPFADSLIRGLLIAADHSLRDALIGGDRPAASRAIRAAIDIIEEDAHLPLTLSSIATRSYISARSLQEGFQRQLGTTPMAYLREVRLRRAHQTLLESEPSVTTVASVAHRWGFSNLGRFAAAHAGRYRETPVETLRRNALQSGRRRHT